MPPIKKFSKEKIIDVTYELLKNEGIENINVRRIAKELNGSVHLIYHNFSNMDELLNEVYKKIYIKYQDIIKNAKDDNKPYLAKGLAYIKFAYEYPEFYKIIFMQESKMDIEKFMMSDIETIKNVILSINKKFDIKNEDLIEFHKKIWIFTHGLASLIVTKTINFNEEKIKKILIDTVNEMFIGYKERKKYEKCN